MTTFHAVVWMDHTEAHVLMFDRDHVQAQKIRSRSHHKSTGRNATVDTAYLQAISKALIGVHEVLLTGPGAAKDEFAAWARAHAPQVARTVVEVLSTDHPSDAQLVALARKYFVRHDRMGADPTQV